jgi:hypothetical protein
VRSGLGKWSLSGRRAFHWGRFVPERLVRVITRTDGREVPIYATAHHEREATKQASKKEIRNAQRLLKRDPLVPASE